MKILQVIPYFVPAWSYGGPVPAVYNLSKELVKKGHEVTVYTTDALEAKNRIREAEEIIDGIDVRRFKNLSDTIAYNHNIFLSPGIIPEVKKRLKSFDIIHLHEYRTIQNIIVHRYAMKYGIPYVLQAHGSVPRVMAKKRLKQLYDNLWGYKLLRDALRVIALTETEAEQYKSMGVTEDKIEIIPSAIDLSEFENLPERGEFRRKYGLNCDQKVILYLARIHKIKGPGLLVKAFAGLAKELDTAMLVIVGPDDGYLPSLKELIKEQDIEEKVLFTGPLYGKKKLEAYVDADVYVLPSVYETFPLAVLEAFACGTPVIVTDRCGIADMVNCQAGVVVSYDKDQLSNAMLRILSDDEKRREFAEKGKLLVREKFNWQKIAEQAEHIYLGCLSSRY